MAKSLSEKVAALFDAEKNLSEKQAAFYVAKEKTERALLDQRKELQSQLSNLDESIQRVIGDQPE